MLALVETVVLWLFTAACLFVPAGTLHWPAAWWFMLLNLLLYMVSLLVAPAELVRQRAGVERGVKRWDPPLATAGYLFLSPVALVVAGLDFRHAPSSPPAAAQWLGTLLFVAGNAFALWAMRVNPFLVKFVRIQTERGHHVVRGGPYGLVRHPAYLGGVVGFGVAPLLLGSLRAALPVAVGTALLVLRTALEDRTLQAELPGYRDYCSAVRWRLLPGVW